jgi:hypothetical protein
MKSFEINLTIPNCSSNSDTLPIACCFVSESSSNCPTSK